MIWEKEDWIELIHFYLRFFFFLGTISIKDIKEESWGSFYEQTLWCFVGKGYGLYVIDEVSEGLSWAFLIKSSTPWDHNTSVSSGNPAVSRMKPNGGPWIWEVAGSICSMFIGLDSLWNSCWIRPFVLDTALDFFFCFLFFSHYLGFGSWPLYLVVAEIMQFVGSLAMSKRVFVKLCSPNCRIDLPNKIWNNSAESGSGWVPWCEFWWDGSVGRVTNGHIFGLPPICSQCERIIINLNILICMQQFYYAVWLHLVLLLFVCVCV